jgi:hypothetical protein
MAVLGIMNSYLEPADEPNGLTLRELIEGAPNVITHDERPIGEETC